jgi:hypothetical protein
VKRSVIKDDSEMLLPKQNTDIWKVGSTASVQWQIKNGPAPSQLNVELIAAVGSTTHVVALVGDHVDGSLNAVAFTVPTVPAWQYSVS